MNVRKIWNTVILLAIVTLTTMGLHNRHTHQAHGFYNAFDNNEHHLVNFNGSTNMPISTMNNFTSDASIIYSTKLNENALKMLRHKNGNDSGDLLQTMNNTTEMAQPILEEDNSKNTQMLGDASSKDISKELFDRESLAIQQFSMFCIVLKNRCGLLDQLHENNLQLINEIADDLNYYVKVFIFNTQTIPDYSTVERRKNIKIIVLSLSQVAYRLKQNLKRYEDYYWNPKMFYVYNEAEKIVQSIYLMLPGFLVKIPICEDIQPKEKYDYFNVGYGVCNPMCDYNIAEDLSTTTRESTEITNASLSIMKIYDTKDTRCKDLNKYSDLCDHLLSGVLNFIYVSRKKNSQNRIKNINVQTTLDIDYYMEMLSELVAYFSYEESVLPFKTCCALRTILQKLGEMSIALDKVYGHYGSEEPKEEPQDVIKGTKAISSMIKSSIVEILAKIYASDAHNYNSDFYDCINNIALPTSTESTNESLRSIEARRQFDSNNFF